MSERELRPLPPDVERLLSAERASPDPGAEARNRVRSRLQVSLGIGLGAAAAVSVAKAAALTTTAAQRALSQSAPSLMSKSLALKLTAALVGVSTLGAGAYLALRSRPTVERPGAAAAPAVAPSLVVPIVAPPAAPAPAAVVRQIAAATPRPPRARPAPADHLADEELLLEEARWTLRRGDYRRALSALAQHDRRFHDGQLAEERESLWVKALVAADEPAQARARGAAFEARYPRSLFGPVVEATLRALP